MLNIGLLFAANVTPENREWVNFSRLMFCAVLVIVNEFDGPWMGSVATGVLLAATTLDSTGTTAKLSDEVEGMGSFGDAALPCLCSV